MTAPDSIQFLSFITGLISLLSGIWLVSAYKYIHPDKKYFPLKTIIILACFGILQSITTLLDPILPVSSTFCGFNLYMFLVSTYFAISWSVIIAIYSLRYLHMPESQKSISYTLIGFLLCLIGSACFPVV